MWLIGHDRPKRHTQFWIDASTKSNRDPAAPFGSDCIKTEIY